LSYGCGMSCGWFYKTVMRLSGKRMQVMSIFKCGQAKWDIDF